MTTKLWDTTRICHLKRETGLYALPAAPGIAAGCQLGDDEICSNEPQKAGTMESAGTIAFIAKMDHVETNIP